MNLKKYYYHTIEKDSEDINEIYIIFEEILKSGGLKSKSIRNNAPKKNTMNGNNYISLVSYVPKTKKNVPFTNRQEFKKSRLAKEYFNYREYIKMIEKQPCSECAMSKQIYFEKNNTNNIRDYYNYLDSLAILFPIDLKWFFKDEITNDKIINYIYHKTLKNNKSKEVGYFYANENAYDKYVINSNGITIVISKEIQVEETILIPNLVFGFFDKKMEKELNECETRRYTNLIGEIQVKNEISLNNFVGLILNENIDVNKIKNIIKKYNIKIPIIKK